MHSQNFVKNLQKNTKKQGHSVISIVTGVKHCFTKVGTAVTTILSISWARNVEPFT
jgi:hypothetical protein